MHKLLIFIGLALLILLLLINYPLSKFPFISIFLQLYFDSFMLYIVELGIELIIYCQICLKIMIS